MASKRTVSYAIVISTAHRPLILERAIRSIACQDVCPQRVIIADGAIEDALEPFIQSLKCELALPILYHKCKQKGAAAQRNEAAELVSEDIILFMDDDVNMEPGCLAEMMKVFVEDKAHEIGGVGVILTNQHYRQPSKWFKHWLDFLAGERAESYAGRVIGPAINLLPAPSEDGCVVKVDWLNTTCTAYRREAFEAEKFSSQFTGYSILEDVHLSLRVGRQWKLVVATAACAFHDSQPSRYKDPFTVAKMEIKNRYLVMVEVLNRADLKHHLKFFLLVMFGLFCRLRKIRSVGGFSPFLRGLAGCFLGLIAICPTFFSIVLHPEAIRQQRLIS